MPIIQDIGEFDNSNHLSSKQELQDQRGDYIIQFSRVLVEYNTSQKERKKNSKAALEFMACIKYADVEIVLACTRTHMTFLNSL